MSVCVLCENKISFLKKVKLSSVDICRDCFFQYNNSAETLTRELLKKATHHKKEKDYKKAIDTFLLARKLIPSSGVCFGLDIYFRLPAYLIADNRPDEAVEEYKKLLDSYLPNQNHSYNFMLSNNSEIYSELSRFYLKTAPVLSANYALASNITHIIKIKITDMSFAFKEYLKKESLKQTVADILKKSELTEYYDQVFKLFTKYSNKKTFSFDEFSDEFNSIIEKFSRSVRAGK